MIVVCDNTEIAEVLLREHIGQREVETFWEDLDSEEEETASKRKRQKMRVSYGATKTSFRSFSRTKRAAVDNPHRYQTPGEVESEDPEATRTSRKELREIVTQLVNPANQARMCAVSYP